MQETTSKWTNVSDAMKQTIDENSGKKISLGKYTSYWFYKTPRRMLHSLSYYKFAAKMIGKQKRVLDLGCNEGLGTYLLAKECGYAQGLDFDEEALQAANANFSYKELSFVCSNIMTQEISPIWDAVTSFDMIEHLLPEHENLFFEKITGSLKPEGSFIIGTPSLISQQFASDISKKGHVNIYSPEKLEETMKKYFSFVFLFAANDEVIHTGYLPLAHYLIAIGCKKK